MQSNNQRKISPARACFLILVLLTFEIYFGKHGVQDYLIMSRGVTINGTATSSHNIRSGYHIDYYFKFEGATYQGHSVAPSAWVLKTTFPSPIYVRLLPSDPTLNWPSDIGLGNPLWGDMAIALFLLALAVILAIKAILDSRVSSNNESTA